MNAGKRDRKIWFQTKNYESPPRNTFGEEVFEWEDDFYSWASFEPIGSREFPSAEKLNASSTARFRILYKELLDPAVNANVSANYRIRLGIQYWDIFPPVETKRRAELLIEAQAVEPPEE